MNFSPVNPFVDRAPWAMIYRSIVSIEVKKACYIEIEATRVYEVDFSRGRGRHYLVADLGNNFVVIPKDARDTEKIIDVIRERMKGKDSMDQLTAYSSKDNDLSQMETMNSEDDSLYSKPVRRRSGSRDSIRDLSLV